MPSLPAEAFAFLLLAARLGAACMLLPGIGETELPSMVRAGFTLAFSALLMPVLRPAMPALPPDPWGLAGLAAAELATGLWIGWLARLTLQILPIAGQLVADIAGLSNVIQPDPALGPQTSVLSTALGLAAVATVCATGLHRLPLQALANSYALVPPGHVLPATDSTAQAVAALAEGFALAVQLASPFLLAATLWQFSLGLMSRLVPQMQVYFAAMPGQLAGGLLLIALLAQGLLAAWAEYAGHAFTLSPAN